MVGTADSAIAVGNLFLLIIHWAQPCFCGGKPLRRLAYLTNSSLCTVKKLTGVFESSAQGGKSTVSHRRGLPTWKGAARARYVHVASSTCGQAVSACTPSTIRRPNLPSLGCWCGRECSAKSD